MTDRVFVIKGILPIPVGNTVEVVVFALRTQLFGAGLSPMPHDPLVRDYVTGVVYGRQWHFTNDGSAKATEVPLELRHDLVAAERVVGRVRATRVFHGKVPDEGSTGWITTLVVAVETPGQSPAG